MNVISVPRTTYFPVVIILSGNVVVLWYLLLLWSVGVCSITSISICKYQAISHLECQLTNCTIKKLYIEILVMLQTPTDQNYETNFFSRGLQGV